MTRMLEDMKDLRHQHIMDVMAVLNWEGSGRFLMYQWADGGNLRDLYRTYPNLVLSATFVRQIVSQLWGLSSALSCLHNFNPTSGGSYRHGNLKPENILRFENGTSVGILKISDLGLADFHIGETGFREPTAIRYGTPSYEPPEVILDADLARSQQYDIWSIGCIFLELLVWVLYGYEELEKFNHSICSSLGTSRPYWVMEETDGPARSARVHPIVVDLMEVMAKELALAGPTAIGDFLELVRTRLLVVPVARGDGSFGQMSSSSSWAPSSFRANAAGLETYLKRALERAELDEEYAYVSIMRRGSVGPVQSIQRPDLAPSQFRNNVPVIKRQEMSPIQFPLLDSARNRFYGETVILSHVNTAVATEHLDSHEVAELRRMSAEKHGETSTSPYDLTRAIESNDRIKALELLENFFDQVAVQEYSWLTELVPLGFSPQEITDELLEKAIQGPWIHESFEEPRSGISNVEFHRSNCVHGYCRNEPPLYVENSADFVNSVYTSPHGRNIIVSDPGDNDVSNEQISPRGIQGVRDDLESTPTPRSEEGGVCLTARQRIEYFCGLGGVRPAADGSTTIRLGSVCFEDNNSRASVTLNGSDDNSAVLEVLDNIEQAAGELQRLGGCCHSFSVLLNDALGGYVVLKQIHFSTIRMLRDLIRDPGMTDPLTNFYQVFHSLFGREGFMKDIPQDASSLQHLVLLATQFLALGFLSYSQAHCGPIQPFFLDTPLLAISLLGLGESYLEAPHATLSCHLVDLTCMGDMVGQPVLAFDWPPGLAVGKRPVMPSTPRKHMLATPESILDTWGPGSMVASAIDPKYLWSVSVGGGTITSTGRATEPQLHWSKDDANAPTTERTFNRGMLAIIGTTILENTACQSGAGRLKDSLPMLKEIGTFPSYWEIMERQLGLGFQGGQTAVAIFQFNQTWVKMPGVTKKSAMLSQRAIYVSDLDHILGVQVSICTGIARRVRLRDLLADLLPAYVAGLVVEPVHWEDLIGKFDALVALRGSDMKKWLGSLDRPSRVEFEGLVFAVLYLLRDTGIDRKGDNFVVACVQRGLPFQCFKIPCKNENSWARMLVDSKDNATFAYVTTQCLETAALKCCRPSLSWSNSTALMGTAVLEDTSASDKSLAMAPAGGQWALRENEAYLIGQTDKKLYVQVRRPAGLDPHLLVSPSAIPPDFLQRLLRRGKLKRLREKKYSENCTESVVICAHSKYL